MISFRDDYPLWSSNDLPVTETNVFSFDEKTKECTGPLFSAVKIVAGHLVDLPWVIERVLGSLEQNLWATSQEQRRGRRDKREGYFEIYEPRMRS